MTMSQSQRDCNPVLFLVSWQWRGQTRLIEHGVAADKHAQRLAQKSPYYINSIGFKQTLAFQKKYVRLDFQSVRNPTKRSHRRVPRSSFEVADIAAFHLRRHRELFLGHPLQLALVPDVDAEKPNHIHASMWTGNAYRVCIPIVSFY